VSLFRHRTYDGSTGQAVIGVTLVTAATRGHAWNINIRPRSWIINRRYRGKNTRAALMIAYSEMFPVMN
jgi:hypothetical protein